MSLPALCPLSAEVERGTWRAHVCINTWRAEPGDDISFAKFGTLSQTVIYHVSRSVWVSVPGCQLGTALPFFNKRHQSSSYTGLWKIGQRPHCVHPAAGEAALIWIVTWLVFPPGPPEVWAESVNQCCHIIQGWWPSLPLKSFLE